MFAFNSEPESLEATRQLFDDLAIKAGGIDDGPNSLFFYLVQAIALAGFRVEISIKNAVWRGNVLPHDSSLVR